jgi:hypothetical protein
MGGDEKQAKPKKANTIRVCQRKKFQKKNSFYRAEQRKQKTAVRKHVWDMQIKICSTVLSKSCLFSISSSL